MGTVLDERLYKRVQERALEEGCSISLILEQALRLYLEQRTADGAALVGESFGRYALPGKALREILDDDPYDT